MHTVKRLASWENRPFECNGGGESIVRGEHTEDSGDADWWLKEEDKLFDSFTLLFY